MIKFTLLCSLGMSTSLLVDKMTDEAKNRGIEVDIDALPFDRADIRLEDTDVLLLGPQVRHLVPKFKEKYKDKIPVIDQIDIRDYGLMRGEKILTESIEKYENAKK